MTNEELIEELLFEAEALGVRETVLAQAVRLRQMDPKLTPAMSCEQAYHQIVNKKKKK
jgi:hypothetical protein